MKLTQEQISHIMSEVEGVDFGRVVIEINAEDRRVDVITERRKRFKAPSCGAHPNRVESGLA
jgi:hypothetical protein